MGKIHSTQLKVGWDLTEFFSSAWENPMSQSQQQAERCSMPLVLTEMPLRTVCAASHQNGWDERVTAPSSYSPWWRLVKSSLYFLLLVGMGTLWAHSGHSPPFALVSLSAHSPLSPSQADTANLLGLPLKIPALPINHNSDSMLDQFNGLQNSTPVKPSDTSLKICLWLDSFIPRCFWDSFRCGAQSRTLAVESSDFCEFICIYPFILWTLGLLTIWDYCSKCATVIILL